MRSPGKNRSTPAMKLAALLLFGTALASCVVDSVCFNDADCERGKVCVILPDETGGSCESKCDDDDDCSGGFICDDTTDKCSPAECGPDDPCAGGMSCIDGRCGTGEERDAGESDSGRESMDSSRPPSMDAGKDAADAEEPDTAPPEPVEEFKCPDGMVSVKDDFCVDIYEASHPDATKTSIGTDDSEAVSKKGVLPWLASDNKEAQKACEAVDKTLCTSRQWEKACKGPKKTKYSYGDKYSATKCNGIDKYCECPSESDCADANPCPFPHCYVDCGRSGVYTKFKLDPTGNNPKCTNGFGVFDINGNVWEHTYKGDETTIRGGAYNCVDSEKLHACDYVPGDWEPAARGFRCCAAGKWVEVERGSEPGTGK